MGVGVCERAVKVLWDVIGVVFALLPSGQVPQGRA